MPKIVKWSLISFAVLVLIIVAAVVAALRLIDVEQYKPQIETAASKALNRPLTLGGKISPSVFPWIGIGLSDVHLGNPTGFKEKNFVSVGQLEVRIKLLPLLSRQIQIKRFVIKDPQIVLIKNEKGVSNLEGLAKSTDAKPPEKKEQKGVSNLEGSGKSTDVKPPEKKEQNRSKTPQTASGLPIQSLQADEVAITNGRLTMIDRSSKSRQEIQDINLVLSDITLDRPITIKQLSARIDKDTVRVTGTVGPVGPDLGKNPIPLNIAAVLLDQITLNVKGRIDHPSDTPEFSLQLEIPEFSVREVLMALGQSLLLTPSDPNVLNSLALSMKLTGTPERITLSDGKLTLDDSHMTFQGRAQAFDKPDLSLKAELDQIDVDRYLPPPAEKKESETPTPEEEPTPAGPEKKTDYTALRKLKLDAKVKMGSLKAKNTRLQNIDMAVTAQNGIIRLDSLALGLYKGQLTTSGVINVQSDRPKSQLDLSVKNVQASPLIKDFLDKNIIEGVASAAINLNFTGDQPDLIRKTLDGKGQLTFQDGAIVGIDLANMVRNVQSAFGLTEKQTEKPRTDFSELVVPFSITQGLAKIDSAKLNSPLLRIAADGKVNLVKEKVNILVNPKFVATIKGQGDTEERAGIMVPVNIRGKFTDLRFEPDLQSILKSKLSNKQAVEKLLPDQKQIEKLVPPEKEIKKELEKKAQELFKGLPFGKPDKDK